MDRIEMPDGVADQTLHDRGSVRRYAQDTESDRREGTAGSSTPARSSPVLRREETVTDAALPHQPRTASSEDLLSALKLLSKGRQARSRWSSWIGFLLCVVLPTAIVGTYYYFIATDQYTAEFRFSITETNPILPGTSPSSTGTTAAGAGAAAAAAAVPLIGSFASMMGSSNAAAQNYVVIDYLTSQQAVDELEKRLHIKEMYSGAETADWWARFDRDQPIDRFLPYWDRMVTAHFDPIIGIATVKVRAFTPDQALLIGNTMVTLAEELVNEIAMRPMRDAIHYAENEVKRAEARLAQARAALAKYRGTEGVVDPTGSIANNVALVQALRGQLAQLQIEYGAVSRQQQNPNAPALRQLSYKIASAREELSKAESEVSKSREGSPAIADLAAKYEQLDLDRQYAAAMVVSSMQALDQARANAAAQHYYLTPYVRPSLATSPSYPKRFQSTVLAGLAFLGLWIVGLMVVRSVKEHL